MTRLKKRKRGRKLRIVGSVAMHMTGREANVICDWRPRHLLHDVKLTSLLLQLGLPMLNWKRGMKTNSEMKPDAEMNRLMVEYDMNTEGKKQIQQQAKRYTKTKSWVLWVFQNASRFNLLEGAAPTSNTLVMVDGSDMIYDLKGYNVPVDKLVEILGT